MSPLQIPIAPPPPQPINHEQSHSSSNLQAATILLSFSYYTAVLVSFESIIKCYI